MKLEVRLNRQNLRLSALIALGIIIYALLFIIFAAGILKNSARILRISKDLKTAQADLSNMAKIESGFALLQSRGSLARDKLLSGEELPQFLEELSRVAKDSDIKLLSLKPLTQKMKVGTSKLMRQYFQLELKGGYHNIGKFFSRLEASQKFIKINAFGINKKTMSPSEEDVVLYLSIYLKAS